MKSYQKLNSLYYSNNLLELQIEPLINFEQGNEGKIRGRVTNLDLFSLCSISGMSADCYDATGVWTTAEPKVKQNLKQEQGRYFIPTALDVDDQGWYIEVGTICANTFSFDVIETYIPLNIDGIFNTQKTLATGYKFIRLYSVTESAITLEQQLLNFGYGNEQQQSNYLLNSQAVDIASLQDISGYRLNLLDLAISLVPLVNARYQNPGSLQQRAFYNLNEPDYLLNKIVVNTFSYLADLINISQGSYDQPIGRQGSIPSQLFQFYQPGLIYGSGADQIQELSKLVYLETDCIEPECIESVDNLIKSDRSISNKAIAWLLYSLVNYQSQVKHKLFKLTSEQYQALEQATASLATYLSNQFEPRSNRFYQGWTDAQQLQTSEIILEHDLSTDIIAALACLAYWEQTQENNYLDIGYQCLRRFRPEIEDLNFGSYEEINYALYFANLTQDHSLTNKIYQGQTQNQNFYTFLENLPADLSSTAKQDYLVQNKNDLYQWENYQNAADDFDYLLALNTLTINLNQNFYEPTFYFNYQNNVLDFIDLINLNLSITLDSKLKFSFPVYELNKITFQEQYYYQKFIDYLPRFVQPQPNNQLDLFIKSIVRSLAVSNLTKVKNPDPLLALKIQPDEDKPVILTSFQTEKDKLNWLLTKEDINFKVTNLKEQALTFNHQRNWRIIDNSIKDYGLEYLVNKPVINLNSQIHKSWQADQVKTESNILIKQEILSLHFSFNPSFILNEEEVEDIFFDQGLEPQQ